MTRIAVSGPNAEQIEYWNETSGPKWAALGDVIDRQIAPLGRAAMERAALAAGERVLDVGCGCGHTSLELAGRVGPAGAVLGADISAVMLEQARERARAAGLPHLRFENVDAQTHDFGPDAFDVAYSRFGVMFFADPRAAFANLLRGLRPGGRLSFVCWQELGRNPWMRIPVAAVAQHVALPVPASPEAPGPFAFADAERVQRILVAAGFADVRAEPLERELDVAGGADLGATVDFLLQIGPAGAALREAGAGVREKVARAVLEAIAPFETPAGVRMPAAAWIFSAARPA